MSGPTLTELCATFAGYDPDAMPVPTAQQLIGCFVQPIADTETLPLKQALGRVLAEAVISPINVPAHDNAAMDGFALHSADLHASQPVTLPIIGTALAGKPFTGDVGSGQCVRIMTGAVMPGTTDTVVPQEWTHQASTGTVTLAAAIVRAGANRRLAGEDLAQGLPALTQGRLLTPADLGLLASIGMGQVSVRRKLRVAYFSTGDELRSIGESLDEGCVYDSNRYTLHGMLVRLGCEPLDMGVIQDDPAAIEAALRHGCLHADAIITSGGVSVGEADYTRHMMARLGDVLFWKINMRPGRSMAFGRISPPETPDSQHSAYLFGLPGNPVAVMVTFYFFARQALLRMMGAMPEAPIYTRVASATAIRKKPGRTEYQRGIVSVDQQGQQSVRITGSQGSGILSSMSEANCMVVLHHAQGDVQAGDVIDVMLFDALV